MRFGHSKIRSTYQIDQADYIACHKTSYVNQYEILEGLKPGGTFLLNCPWDAAELENELPAKMKKYIAENNIQFYTIDAVKLPRKLVWKTESTWLQTAFFKLTNVIPFEKSNRTAESGH